MHGYVCMNEIVGDGAFLRCLIVCSVIPDKLLRLLEPKSFYSITNVYTFKY